MDKRRQVLLFCTLTMAISFTPVETLAAHHATKKIAHIHKNHVLKNHRKRQINKAEKNASTAATTQAVSSPVTGTFDLTSNYIFRGVSQSNNIPAVQGGLTYTFQKTGIYFGFWGSNVYAPIIDSPSVATLELDGDIGIANSINDNTKYDLHFVRYFYPKATAAQYNEVIGSLTYRFLTGLIGYTNNFLNSGASGTYGNLAVNINLPAKYIYFEDVSINAAIGHYAIARGAGNSYNDYSLSINKTLKNYVLSLAWNDTNHRFTDNSLDCSRIVATITANF